MNQPSFPVPPVSTSLSQMAMLTGPQIESQTQGHRAWLRFRQNLPAVAGLILFSSLTLVIILGPLVWSHSSERIDLRAADQGPSLSHPFGTDELGRDLLARVLAGGRVSLSVAFLATSIAVAIGVFVGAIAGYAGSWVGSGLMHVTDMFLTMPVLPILILGTALFAQDGTFRQRYLVIVIVIGALSWMVAARLVRASVLSLKQSEFVTAAKALGSTPTPIIVRHILPNAFGPVIVIATLGIGTTIIIESSLSFLGLGFQPPQATWGRMLYEAQSTLTTHPIEAIVPGLAIVACVTSVNAIGDGLRDALDPYGTR